MSTRAWRCPHKHSGGEVSCQMCPGAELRQGRCSCCGTEWGRNRAGHAWVMLGPEIEVLVLDEHQTHLLHKAGEP